LKLSDASGSDWMNWQLGMPMAAFQDPSRPWVKWQLGMPMAAFPSPTIECQFADAARHGMPMAANTNFLG